MAVSRWTPGCKANKMLLKLIQDGTITKDNVNNESHMVTMYSSDAEFRRFTIERFVQAARDALEKKDDGSKLIGKCIICHVIFCFCVLTSSLHYLAAGRLNTTATAGRNVVPPTSTVRAVAQMPSKASMHTGNPFVMPGVGYSWKDEHHKLRYSVVFYAPGGVAADKMKHMIVDDGKKLVVDFTLPSMFAHGEALIGGFIRSDGQPMFPAGSARMVAIIDAIDKLKSNEAVGVDGSPPSFRMFHDLPFPCRSSVVGHGGYAGEIFTNSLRPDKNKVRVVTLVYYELDRKSVV